MRWVDLCGFPVEINIGAARKVAKGDCLVLRVDKDKWVIKGSIVESSVPVTTCYWDCNRVFAPLAEGRDACAAVLSIIDDAAQTASLKL